MKKDMMKKDMKNGLEAISEISGITSDSTSTARSSGSFSDRVAKGLKKSGPNVQKMAKKSLDTAKHMMRKKSTEGGGGGGNYGSLDDSTEGNQGNNAGFQLAQQQRPKKVWFGRDDSWFGRDFSFRATFAPSIERKWDIMERLLGPTDWSFPDMVTEKGGLGLEYNSVDRGVIDTAVWHRRKVSLIQDEAGKSGASSGGTVDRRSTMLNANIFQYDDEGYVYDHEAVKRLDRERGQLEYALVVVTGFIMAVIGIAVSHSADIILEMKLDSAIEVREREMSSYSHDRAFAVL